MQGLADSSADMLMKVTCVLVSVVALLFSGSALASADRLYESALQSIDEREYAAALQQLRRLQRDYPTSKKLQAAKTRIAVLQESADAGNSLPAFLDALTLRDTGQIDDALTALDVIAQEYPAGPLTDDALYISAYLQVMDRYDFSAARVALQTLQERFPGSAYSDSALYLDAIAMEQLGDTAAAREALVELRDRHTVLSLPLGFRWPAGTMLSRYWFDRADRRLAIVDKRIAGASELNASAAVGEGQLQVTVNVDGQELLLSLKPSPLTQSTQWLDAGLRDQLPPSVGVYDGKVSGVENSWVRATLLDGSLSGVVYLNGEQKQLLPANLQGTLDYYQPVSRKPTQLPGGNSELAKSVQALDMLVAPPSLKDDLRSRSVSKYSDVRTVPISIVVDSQYDRYYAGAGLASALGQLNIADGVYRQFGLALTLDEAIEFDEGADPLMTDAVSLETILRSFRQYRLDYGTLFSDSALTYLFSGNPKTDITLGLAWIDTACRVDGYDVGVTTPTSFGEVLLTHELGHSFGAQHDTDTQCNNDSGSVMWPNISEDTQTTFSSCSQQSVLGARSNSCLLNSVDLQASAYAQEDSVGVYITNTDSVLTLDAQVIVETSAPDQLLWPDQCVAQTPTSATCTIASLNPSSTQIIEFAVAEAFQNSSAPITAEVQPTGVYELQKSDNLATVILQGGAVSENQIAVFSSTNPTGLSDLASSDSEPDTGAASSGSARLWELLLLAFGLLLCKRRRYQL